MQFCPKDYAHITTYGQQLLKIDSMHYAFLKLFIYLFPSIILRMKFRNTILKVSKSAS